MLKKIFSLLLIILIIIQFFRPDKNESDDQTNAMANLYPTPMAVDHILKVSCNDCHSNKTNYPWYSEIQPVAWWLNEHVTNGKKHLNFSDFTKLPIAVQYHKFEEMVEMVEKKEMPLPSYTNLGLHKEANLTEKQRQSLIEWTKVQMLQLKSSYPADSLVMKRRRKAKPKNE